MRILMLLENDFSSDLRVENEIETLTKTGHQVFLACYANKGKPLLEKNENLTILRFKAGNFFRKKLSAACLTLPFYFHKWQRFAEEIIRNYNIDAIHIHDLPLAKVGYDLKKKFGIKFILDFHENYPAAVKIYEHTNTLKGKILSPYHKWLDYENKSVNFADFIILVVEEAKKRFQDKIDKNKLIIVSNTLNIEHFKFYNQSRKRKETVLFYAGKINKHRGLQIVLKAILILKLRNIKLKFIVAGNGNYLSKLKIFVREKSLEDYIQFIGWQSLETVAKTLSNSDFAIIPHLKSEHTDTTIPHKLFQYMYLNKFIISSDCAPLKRIITETQAGEIYKNNSPSDLANLLMKVIDKKEKGELKIDSKRFVEKKYNWEIDKKNLLDLYAEFENNGQ